MTPEFNEWFEWFDDSFPSPLFSEEEREELKIYTWMAWRDSRRKALQEGS